MEFPIFPLVMVAFCVAMMVVMMRGMHGGKDALSGARTGCCGLGFGSVHEQGDRMPSETWRRQQPTSTHFHGSLIRDSSFE
jgi:hypothetical protein